MALIDAHAETRLPVANLDRARRWYAEKLLIHPVGERPGHLIYALATGTFCLFTSTGSSDGTFSQLALRVEDIDAEVVRLAAAGMAFERYPHYRMDGPVAAFGGDETTGPVDRVAWFHDLDNNLISLFELQPSNKTG